MSFEKFTMETICTAAQHVLMFILTVILQMVRTYGVRQKYFILFKKKVIKYSKNTFVVAV